MSRSRSKIKFKAPGVDPKIQEVIEEANAQSDKQKESLTDQSIAKNDVQQQIDKIKQATEIAKSEAQKRANEENKLNKKKLNFQQYRIMPGYELLIDSLSYSVAQYAVDKKLELREIAVYGAVDVVFMYFLRDFVKMKVLPMLGFDSSTMTEQVLNDFVVEFVGLYLPLLAVEGWMMGEDSKNQMRKLFMKWAGSYVLSMVFERALEYTKSQ